MRARVSITAGGCGAAMLGRAIGMACLLLAPANSLVAQPPPTEPSKERDPAPALSLPQSLPDGRLLRPIGLYQSQLDELIPKDYRPVSIERFREAVMRLVDRATDDQASRLKGAVYWVEVVDDLLISNRSVIDIESDRPSLVRRSLGQVNLAIEPAAGTLPAGKDYPRLESEIDGDLVAVFRGDDKNRFGIEFKWRLRGQVSGSGHEFTMLLPRTPQTRIVLFAPADVTVQSLDGVLRSRPGPPPDAGDFVTDRELRWYELDAGGLSRVRIRTQRERPQRQDGSFIVRRSSLQYEVDPSGLSWSGRMDVQMPTDRPFPTLTLSGTTVTAVSINAQPVAFTSKIVGGRTRQIEITAPPGLVGQTVGGAIDSPAAVAPRGAAPVTPSAWFSVTVTGHSQWTGSQGWWDLPMPAWVGQGIVQASAFDDVQLLVNDPLQLMSWQLPADWEQTAPQLIDRGITLYAADGPPVTVPAEPATADSEQAAGSSRGTAWSRIRVIDRPVLASSSTALRLEVDAGSLTAKARVAFVVDPSRIEPLQLRVEPGWSLESVAFVKSGRMIESPSVSENSGLLSLWPEAEDASAAEIVLEVSGSRILPSTSGGLVVPATWFVRPLGVRGELLAAIAPPAELNWSGEAVLQRERVDKPALNAAQDAFFSGLDPEALWFRPVWGRVPSVSLLTPSVSFNAQTVLQITRQRGELSETLHVKVESQGQSLKQLEVHTGPVSGRPPWNWSISGSGDSPSTSLTPSDVAEGDGDGIYTIDLSDKNLRGRSLIARRRYPAENQFELQLPSIPGAASQSSDLIIGPGLLIQHKPDAVQLVPFTEQVAQPELAPDALSAAGILDFDASLLQGKGGFTRLRYDAVEQPSITLLKSDTDPNVTIVWREQVRVIASSRGSDRIEAVLKVSPTAPLEIEYEPELQLVSVSRDGEAVDLMTVEQRPKLILQPRGDSEWIRIVWNRNQFESGWLRQCRIPRIQVSGTILSSEHQLVSSPDTFAPAALFRGLALAADSTAAFEVRPGDNAVLIRRNVALAMGWLMALLVFALGWLVAERVPLAAAAAVVVMTTLLCLWWPWRIALIGWLIVPMVSAALLAATRARGAALGQPGSANGPSRPSGVAAARGSTVSAGPDRSAEFSFDQLAQLMLIACGLIGMAAVAVAQGTPLPPSAERPAGGEPVNVLVPVDDHGARSGEMIYIPQPLYAQLFPAELQPQPQDARIESAAYRVRIDPNRPDAGALIEAEYLVHVEDGDRSGSHGVHFPLAATSVRRIEWIDDVSRIIHTKVDESGEVIATLPRGSVFRLRVTLLPERSQSDRWTKLSVAVPPVACCRLTVEADQRIEALRVGGVNGRWLSETDLRRWTDELGPVRQLEVDYRAPASAGAEVSKPLQRRYWVHAGKRQVTVDCEVDPPAAMAVGETFQFVVLDSAIPSVTSAAWRLDRSELYNPTRRLITLTCTRDAPGPIRLLWTQPLELAGGGAESAAIRIPEVTAAALGETAPAWIALHCDASLQFAPLGRDSSEPLSVDHFLAAWSGYRGRIDRAYVLLAGIQSPLLQRKAEAAPLLSQHHHLHVMPDQLELQYSATLTASDAARQLSSLRLSQGLQLVRLSVNGQDLNSQPIPSGVASDVSLGDFRGAEEVTINAVAVQPLPANMQFSPPRLTLLPLAATSDVYSISRDRATMLREVKPATVQPTEAAQIATADSLAQGWIPVATWVAAPHQMTGRSPDVTYRVTARPTRFDCRQLIVVNRDAGRWLMETFVRFRSNQIPDYIDIEVPTKWCESLEAGPTQAWSRQPGNDPSRQIIRILCDQDELKGDTLSIRGQLENSESTRVNAPTVRVLGFGQRQIHVNVPGRLTQDEPIEWRTSAVEAVPFPEQWRDRAAGNGRSTYLVANPSWSIDLAPLPEMDTEAFALSMDTRVFAKDNGALMMCHWDLFPGGLGSVDVRLPPGVVCLGAWSAGRAVLPSPRAELNATDAGVHDGELRIPLALSRLSQPLELLCRVSATTSKQASYLPELIGVPVSQRWLTKYVPAEAGPRSAGSEVTAAADCGLALARSAVEAVEAVETVDRRPRDEVAAWLGLWLARYRMLAASQGHWVDLNAAGEADAADAVNDVALTVTPVNNSPTPRQLEWSLLDARIAAYVNRFPVADPNPPGSADDTDRSDLSPANGTPAFAFGVADFEGFAVESVTPLSVSDHPPAVQPASSSDRGLRQLIQRGLTLLLICGLLVCVRPLQRFAASLVVHPAFWLCLMGAFGFAVAPVPVAAAIIIVAITLAAFPAKRPSGRPHGI